MTTKELTKLLRKTRSPYVGERADAERAILDLGAEGIKAVLELVSHKQKNWRRRQRAYYSLVGVFVLFAVPAMIYLIGGAIVANVNGDPDLAGARLGGALGGIFGGLGGGVLGGFAWLLAPPPELLLAARVLARADDLRALGPLVRALGTRLTDAEVRNAAGGALCRLLPTLDEENKGLLPTDERDMLARYLVRSHPDKEEELLIAILHALSVSGDSQTLQAVKSFSERIEKAPQSTRLHESARRCYEALEERVATAHLGENLLRPSVGSDSSILLHPAGSAESEDKQLLRAASRD
jgi:hypothetical protein